MFDDQPINTSTPPNLPTEPVDMFAGVEKNTEESASPDAMPATPNALSAGVLKKRDVNIQTPPDFNSVVPQQEVYKVAGPSLGKAIMVIVILAVLGGAGYGGWVFYSRYMMVQPSVVQTETTTSGSNLPPTQENNLPAAVVPAESSTVTPAVSTTTAASTSNIPAEVNNDQILFGNAVDTDKDGLDDIREKQLGTDPNNPDTDGDGLSDGDEVLIWHTDPLNPDTDGDGYPDGTEVRNGYNPLGPGKLFNVPTSTISASSSIVSTSTATSTI